MTSCDSPAVDLSGAKDFRPVEPVTGHSGAFYFLLSFSYVASHPPPWGHLHRLCFLGLAWLYGFWGGRQRQGLWGLSHHHGVTSSPFL